MPTPQENFDVSETSARVRRLVARYPETSNAVWIIVIVIGFLLIVPIAGGVTFLFASAGVEPLIGFVLGIALWLGVFMGLRQILFWRREAKVAAFIRDFDLDFPCDPEREGALACLKTIEAEDEDNEVVVLCVERLARSGFATPP